MNLAFLQTVASIAVLAAAAPASPAPAPVKAAAFHLDDVPVGVRLEVVAEPAAPSPAFTWKTDGAARVGIAEDRRMQASVRIAPAGPGVFELVFAVSWRVAAKIEREAVRLALPGHGLALRRDLAFAPLAGPLRVDRGTPLLASAGGVVVAPGEGFTAARYTPVRGKGERTEIDLILDDAGAHPFSVYPSCMARIPGLAEGQAIDFAALEHKQFLGRTARRAGDRVEARALLYLLAVDSAPRPLIVERWAAGARAAVVFTDHADRTDPRALAAVLYGSSATAAGALARGGFLGHGLRLTKSFFARARRGGLETDPEARALAQVLRVAGSEVASHSITGEPDDRAAVRAGLPVFGRFGAVTWIDHEPYTNCEAISSQGWRADGPYGIRDLLVAGGFRWIWEAGDIGGFRRAELADLFSVRPPSEPAPAVYPLPVDPRLWVFESTMFYARPSELAAAVSESALDQLEERGGLFIGHTYLSASSRTTVRPEQLERLVVHDGPRGEAVLDPDFDAALGRIAARVRQGRIATLTAAEAGDRLGALRQVSVTYLPDGSAQVENRGAAKLGGLTLAVPGDAADTAIEADGHVDGRDGQEPGRTRAWLDLAPGQAVRVRASHAGAPAPFLVLRTGATLHP
jgi:hypothetical protein